MDAIDVAAARQRKIIVTNTPDVLNDCVVRHRDGAGAERAAPVSRSRRPTCAPGTGRRAARIELTTSLGGKTLGILGLGRIGESIAQRALAFGMKIRYHNRNRKDAPYPYDADVVALAKNSDVLLVATPGGAETNKLVNAKVLDALGPEGYLVNIARGSVIDEPVLLRYLKEKKIAGAGLDVFDDEPKISAEWFGVENAVLFPHVGSATVETRTAMGDLQVENLRRHFSGKAVKTPVQG